SSEAPAASRQSFICFKARSVCCSIGAPVRTSPVSGLNGGRPDTNTMLPARVTGEAGALKRSIQVEIGSTRTASRFMDPSPSIDKGETLAAMVRIMLRNRSKDDSVLNNLPLLQPLHLRLVVADAGQHLAGVGAEQRRGAVFLHGGAGEGDGVADQRQVRLEGMVDPDPHAARLPVRVVEDLREVVDGP